ncbi:MAG: M16 family metallopeptidase [Blastocatellia bacterium]
MYRSGKTIVLIIAIFSLISAAIFAQSGRGRQPTQPAPKPTPRPNTPATGVLGVPDGGKLAAHELDGAISRAVLRNGLTVIIRERHSSPLVAVNVSVKAGLINDPDDLAGLSRLTRYLVLKGTAKHPGAAVDREVARLGGALNSEIGYDLTSYSLIAPSESYQAMVELLADLIQNPAFNPEDAKGAAQLALLESRREQDEADRAAIEKLFATAFTANRLKRGGVVSDTFPAQATRDQAMAFYQNFYHPANTVVTIVGDIFALKALGQIQLHFGNFKKAAINQSKQSAQQPAAGASKTTAANSKPAPTPAATETERRRDGETERQGDRRTGGQGQRENPQSAIRNPQSAIVESAIIEEPPQDKLRYGNSRVDMSESVVTIGYHTPALKADKEAATLQMMAAVLGLGQGSRLWQGLREGQASRDKAGVVFEIEANQLSLPGAGMFVARMRVDPSRIDRAEAEFFREIERFRRELIGEAELQRARVMLEKEYLNTVSRYEAEAVTLARHQIQSGDHKLFDKILKQTRAVTAQEIQQTAAKYLTLANASVHEYESAKGASRSFTPEKFAELILTFEAKAAQPIRPEEIKPAVALKAFQQGEERGQASEGQNVILASVPLPLKDFSVLRGPRAYVREDKAYPKLSIGVYFQGGRLIEDKTTSGMTELTLRSMMKSTMTRKFDLIAHELESYGGKIQIVNEPDFFGFTLDVMSRNADNAVKLLLDVIENPFFDKTEVARERDAVIADQARLRDDNRQRSIELMWDSLYPIEGGHPYGLPRFGLAEIVKGANEEKLEAWHAKTVKRQFPLVVIVGDTDGSAIVSRIFSEGLKRNELDKTIKANLPNSYATPDDKIEQRSRQSSQLATGFRAPALTPEKQNDLLALAMLGTMASSGKLIEELRDKQSLTDGVSLISDQRLASGVFLAQIATLPENEQRVREALQAALESLVASQLTDDEFEQGRNAEIGRYAIALQDHNARTLEYARAAIFGLKPADVEAQPDLIRAVKKTDIKRVAESVMKSGQAGHGLVRGAAVAQSKKDD